MALRAVGDECSCVWASSSAVVQAGEEDMPVLSPELDHYIQGKDQNECTPLHVAILRGERWWRGWWCWWWCGGGASECWWWWGGW